jgi:hypothetical protein
MLNGIELLHLIDLPSRQMNPETWFEVLKPDGGLVLRSEATAWMVAEAREADLIYDVGKMTVIGE